MQNAEIIIAIVTSILLYIVGTIIIVLFLFRYQKKKLQHNILIEEKERKFKAELIQTEIEVQEQTRKNIASDLHDNIGQLLSLTLVTAGSINLAENQKAADKLVDIQCLLSRSIKELRQLSKLIHGEQLISEGLQSAIEQELAWLKKNNFYSIWFNCDMGGLQTENKQIDLFLFRLFQESVNNILKHSRADTIMIHLSYQSPFVELNIKDDGCGFKVEEQMAFGKGLGLVNMGKRIKLLNGSFKIDSIPGKGTNVVIKVPYT